MMNSLHKAVVILIFFMGPLLRAHDVDQGLIKIVEIEKNVQLSKEKFPTYSQLEIGVGYGFASIADYPASDEYTNKFLFLPLVIYRGNVLKSDQDEGTRAELFKSKELDINLSFGLRFNNESADNKTRQGMPNLNYIFESGPSLNYKLWKEPKVGSFVLRIPLRLTFESDFKSTRFLGLVFEPELKFKKFNLFVENLSATTAISTEFFNERVANYYYQVENDFVNTNRSLYDASEGLSSINISQSFVYEFNKTHLVFGASYNYFGFSKNKKSPLFKSEDNTSIFTAIAWFFYDQKTERE